MVRPFILIPLVLLCACASGRPVPPAPIRTAAPEAAAEPLDPSIKPLSQELEEAGQQKRGPA
ncbi:hypothetical protein C1M53_02130 [Mesorhizobium sp. Pch-S]|jgi:hypothetical protein|nr:hypothetical protein C1M53_02130 [Mesorhizobium sp. Pch-S]